MKNIDPNVVFVKKDKWDYEQLEPIPCKQIEIPNFVTFSTVAQTTIQLPIVYIHTNIVYPDENEYSCDEEDIEAGIDPKVMQQLDLRRHLNSNHNYCKQYSLLNTLEYDETYYNKKVERLQRPLLRLFMRAQENDYRMNVAFRPSKAYKQKRQKHLDIQSIDVAREILLNENMIALNLLRQIKQRELLKLQLIKEEEFNFVNTFNNCNDLFVNLKELKCFYKQEDLIEQQKDNRNKIFESCTNNECSYQFYSMSLSSELIDFMDEQYQQIKDKGVIWPKNPTMLQFWDVDIYTKLGVHQLNKSLIYTTNNRTLMIADRTKKNKKKVKLMLIDRNRASIFDGVRANFDHFYAHYQKINQKQEQIIEQQRKECQKIRFEKQKKEHQLKLQQKKEELKQSLRFKMRILQDLDHPICTIKIKYSDELKFQLVKDIHYNSQVILT
ncbi:unnamed protein product [Paramecium pentaurelia]|uniref:Uncharacterized protein n=1 Tax=Paramecium pentaurelia TaxID=43138 RepID=A0A8S1WFW9_9CILI|nr:unnamed protein product [Paramecium pentaurelia]